MQLVCIELYLLTFVVTDGFLSVLLKESEDSGSASVSKISSLSHWPDHLLKRLDEQQAEADAVNKVNKVSRTCCRGPRFYLLITATALVFIH